jgi:hypothetical protein
VLAEAVLGRDAVRLARVVLEGGEFALERATDLAETVLCPPILPERVAEATDAATSKGRP